MKRIITTLFLTLSTIFALQAQFICEQALPIACGQTINDDNITNCQNTISGGYCGSNDYKYSGREKLYKFEVSQEQTVRIELSGLTSDLDMFLLRSCSPQDCISKSTGPGTQNYELISTTLSPGTYYIAIDGWGGAASSYSLELTCSNSIGELDCMTTIPLNCGESISGVTSSGVNNNDGPYCNQYCNYSGPEQIFEFTVDVKSEVSIVASDLSADVDMFLLNACDRKNCIGLSGKAGANTESIAKTLDPGTYFVVLDGYQDAISTYKMSLHCTPLETIDCSTAITTYYSGDGSNLRFAYIFNGGANTEFIAWKLGGNVISTIPGVNFVFSNPGTYNICAEFKNLSTGEIETCCKTTCVSLPTQCEELIDYQYVDGHFELSLNSSSFDPTSVVWRNDTDGIDIDPNNIPASCRTLLVSVRYFDTASNCYIMCCKNIYFCPPTSCQDNISATYDPTTNAYTFNFEHGSASQQIWKFDDTNEVIENGIYTLPANTQCVDRPVTIYYFDTSINCWKVCCKTIRLCPPQECEGAIDYDYDIATNAFHFTLDNPDATNATWRFIENDQNLQNGTFALPSNWECQQLTVEVSYFDPSSQCWRICSRLIDICPPLDCQTAIDFTFDSQTNTFEFELNIEGASNLYWRFDEDKTHLVNGQFKLPAGWQCQERTVTVFYYDSNSQCWRACCKRINICAPEECDSAIDYTYNGSDNSFEFDLNLSGASEQYWFFNESKVHIPNGKFVLPSDWTCSNQWISVFYYDSATDCWNLCSKQVTICPPSSCEDAISYDFNSFTNAFEFKLDIAGVSETVWKFEDGTIIPNGIFTIPADWTCMNKTISVFYYDPSIDCWKICAKNITICPPDNCTDNIQYEYIAAENAFQFSLDIAGATETYWKFNESNLNVPGGKFTLPNNWQCEDLIISVYYYNTSTECWNICSKAVTICPPADCAENITYGFIEDENKFVFDLDITGATQILWKFDDTKEVLQNGEFVIPANWTCTAKTVTAYYYNNVSETWTSCCRTIYICPPTECQEAITYSYDETGNNVLFHFASDTGIKNFSWQILESNTYLGNDPSASQSLAIPDPCAEVTISIRYELNDVWYYCHKRVYLCNPNECQGLINHSISNNVLTLSVSDMYTNVTWFDSDGNLLGSANEINYNVPNSESVIGVTVIFKDETTNCYRTCNKDIEITCSLPTANFNFTPAGSGVYFTNTSNDASSVVWDFNGGVVVEGDEMSDNPVVVFPSGTYNICIESSNTCGQKLYCEQIVIDNNSTCTFDIKDDVCGKPGDIIEVPVSVTNFKDVLTFNFTIQSNNEVNCRIVGVDLLESTIVNGSNSYFENDHLRFFWSSTDGKDIDDNTNIFNIKVELLEETDSPIVLEFTDDPVNSEAFNSAMELIPLNLEQGSICIDALPLFTEVNGQVIRPETLEPINLALVKATGGAGMEDMTGQDGLYSLSPLSVGGNYTIKPNKTGDPTNGINALDIVLLQRHILQVSILDSPYKYIAADVNADGVINALDVVLMQRIQLRIISDFPNNLSWRFVPTDYIFTNENPLLEDFPEEIVINPLDIAMNDEDFYGIKIGDLNYSADATLLANENAENYRNSDDTLRIKLGSVYSQSTDLVRIPVTVSNFQKVSAIEGTLSWDDSKLALQSLSDYGITSLTADNFGRPEGQENILTFNWTDASLDGTSLDDESVLFYINFQPKGASGEQTVVRFIESPLPLFAADANLETMVIESTKSDVAFIVPMTITESHTDNQCHNGDEGGVAIQVNGGTGNFNYEWSNGATGSEISGLASGIYLCTVTDLYSNAQQEIEIEILSPPALEIEMVTDTFSYASVMAIGGIPPYTYEWSTGDYTSVISNLDPGNYQVTVTDKNDCIIRSEIDIKVRQSTNTMDLTLTDTNLFPNPATENFTISFGNPTIEKFRYQLYNTAGQLIQSKMIKKGSTEMLINSGAFDPGLYYVRLSGSHAIVLPILIARN